MSASNATSHSSFSEKLSNILTNNKFAQAISFVLNEYAPILKQEYQKVFFPDYTKHDIDHLDEVLKIIEKLVPNEILSKLSQESLNIIVASVVFHDIGMLINEEMFKAMVVDGEYDDVRVDYFDKKTWKQLWEEYEYDSNYWDEEQKKNVFGEGKHTIIKPNLDDLQTLDGYKKKYIGEFIRQHHGRIAHEVALKGYFGTERMAFLQKAEFLPFMKMIGIIARSHSMDLRKAIAYLQKSYGKLWRNPSGIPIVYIMILLRLADYLHIDYNRSGLNEKDIDKIRSPFSRQEHEAHRAIQMIHYGSEDPEQIIIEANPHNARTHVKIERLANDIQNEFDHSWAVLGETYHNEYTLNYRRTIIEFIEPDDKTYVERQFRFRLNNNLAKLLVAPLYGDNPSFGVRELVQNAVDACRECMNDTPDDNKPKVVVELDTGKGTFTITDTGKGMSLDDIEKYFLTIGSSFSDNIDWQKKRDKEEIYRTGRFGIGVLAAFLLGDKIKVTTRKRGEEYGYQFETTLSESFIEISEDIKAEYGTKIEIICKPGVIEKFENALDSKHIFFGTWCDWYIDDNPKVLYYCDGAKIVPLKFDNFNGYKILELSQELKENWVVRWKLNHLFSHGKLLLFCNGFYITDSCNKNHFSICYLNNYYPFAFPSLQIIDKHNQLPLNLQRTQIDDNYTYDFEKELAIEVLKYFISELMSLDFRVPSMNYFSRGSMEDWLGHSLCFFLNPLGYTIKCAYTERKIFELSDKNKVVFIGGAPANASSVEKLYDLLYGGNDLVKLCVDAHHYFFNLRMFWHLQEFKTKNFAKKFYNKITLKTKDFIIFNNASLYTKIENDLNVSPIEIYKDYRIYSSTHSSVYKSIIDYMDNVDVKILYICIQDKASAECSDVYVKEFEDLYNQYLGADPIIPYDINKRKEKFPQIFKDFPELNNNLKESEAT